MSVRIRDLRPGDRLAGGLAMESATLISWSVPHPTYPGLALVVWRLSNGLLSVDALDTEQHDVTGSVLVEQSEDERLESLRRAIDGSAASAAVVDVVDLDEGQVRHYIGVIGFGRLHSRVEGSPAGWRRGPHEPLPLGRYREPPNDTGPMLFPVDEVVARAFMGDSFDEGDDDGGESDG